jgi:hypothetical protein
LNITWARIAATSGGQGQGDQGGVLGFDQRRAVDRQRLEDEGADQRDQPG